MHILAKNSGSLCFPHWTPRFPPDPAFSTGPRVFHRTPRFPPDSAFSTGPRVFHTSGPRTPGPRTPGPRTLGPRPRVFHLAVAIVRPYGNQSSAICDRNLSHNILNSDPRFNASILNNKATAYL